VTYHSILTEEQLLSKVKELFPDVTLPDRMQKWPLKELGRNTAKKLGRKTTTFKAMYDPANGYPITGHSWHRCTVCDVDDFGDELCGATTNMRTLRKQYKAEMDALKGGDKLSEKHAEHAALPWPKTPPTAKSCGSSCGGCKVKADVIKEKEQAIRKLQKAVDKQDRVIELNERDWKEQARIITEAGYEFRT
jgi:hypothetical protein